MFYEPEKGHGLPHDPFKAIVAPRPIGWISTVDVAGRPNLAPFSFFNALASSPHLIGFTCDGYKNSVANARETGEFVFNVATLPLAEAVRVSSLAVPAGVSEFDLAGLRPSPSRLVRPPRVSESPASLECKVVHFLEFRDTKGQATDRYLVAGQVIGVHIREEFLRNGRFDVVSAQTMARCGYLDYSVIGETFEMKSNL